MEFYTLYIFVILNFSGIFFCTFSLLCTGSCIPTPTNFYVRRFTNLTLSNFSIRFCRRCNEKHVVLYRKPCIFTKMSQLGLKFMGIRNSLWSMKYLLPSYNHIDFILINFSPPFLFLLSTYLSIYFPLNLLKRDEYIECEEGEREKRLGVTGSHEGEKIARNCLTETSFEMSCDPTALSCKKTFGLYPEAIDLSWRNIMVPLYTTEWSRCYHCRHVILKLTIGVAAHN